MTKNQKLIIYIGSIVLLGLMLFVIQMFISRDNYNLLGFIYLLFSIAPFILIRLLLPLESKYRIFHSISMVYIFIMFNISYGIYIENGIHFYDSYPRQEILYFFVPFTLIYYIVVYFISRMYKGEYTASVFRVFDSLFYVLYILATIMTVVQN